MLVKLGFSDTSISVGKALLMSRDVILAFLHSIVVKYAPSAFESIGTTPAALLHFRELTPSLSVAIVGSVT